SLVASSDRSKLDDYFLPNLSGSSLGSLVAVDLGYMPSSDPDSSVSDADRLIGLRSVRNLRKYLTPLVDLYNQGFEGKSVLWRLAVIGGRRSPQSSGECDNDQSQIHLER